LNQPGRRSQVLSVTTQPPPAGLDVVLPPGDREAQRGHVEGEPLAFDRVGDRAERAPATEATLVPAAETGAHLSRAHPAEPAVTGILLGQTR
jgi:hypothetical protein